MLPVFRPGETALVSSAGLRRGDCAVYSYQGRNLLHRVVKVAASGVWLSDDAGRIAPHLVGWENIRGKALSRNPLAGGLTGLVYSGLRRKFSRLFLNV